MAKKHEYIRKNMKVVNQLVKSGDISCRVLTDYHIYQVYKGYSGITKKMDRYQFTAEDTKTSVQGVMRAIKNMESSI